MSCIVHYRSGVLRYGAAHYITDQISTPGYCEQQIAHDCDRSGISKQEFASSKIVLWFLDEGFGPDDIAPLTDILQQSHAGRFMVVFNSLVNVDELSYHAHCCTTWLINRGEYQLDQFNYNSDIVLDRKFLCLLRRPTMNRARLAHFLLHNVGLDNVRMSFGSGAQGGLEEYRDVVDADLPILVDGLLTDRVQEFDISNSLFHSCLFNVAAETSSQSEANWRGVFLTEKTWKAIMQRQIPIWFGVPGLVSHVRDLGFDVFDDIVDHRYDTIENEHSRHCAVFDLLDQLNQQHSLTDCQQMRLGLRSRLESNFEQLQHYFRTNRRQVNTAILAFDYQTNLTDKSK